MDYLSARFGKPSYESLVRETDVDYDDMMAELNSKLITKEDACIYVNTGVYKVLSKQDKKRFIQRYKDKGMYPICSVETLIFTMCKPSLLIRLFFTPDSILHYLNILSYIDVKNAVAAYLVLLVTCFAFNDSVITRIGAISTIIFAVLGIIMAYKT